MQPATKQERPSPFFCFLDIACLRAKGSFPPSFFFFFLSLLVFSHEEFKSCLHDDGKTQRGSVIAGAQHRSEQGERGFLVRWFNASFKEHLCNASFLYPESFAIRAGTVAPWIKTSRLAVNIFEAVAKPGKSRPARPEISAIRKQEKKNNLPFPFSWQSLR